MNVNFDALRAAAGLHDAETWEKQQVVPLLWGTDCEEPQNAPPLPFGPREDAIPGGVLPGAFAQVYGRVFYVYPSGLVLAAVDVPWFWEGPGGECRMGTTRQALRYLRYRRSADDALRSVPADRVHGSCIRVEGTRADLNGADYKLHFARPFPAWTWGVTWGQP